MKVKEIIDEGLKTYLENPQIYFKTVGELRKYLEKFDDSCKLEVQEDFGEMPIIICHVYKNTAFNAVRLVCERQD